MNELNVLPPFGAFAASRFVDLSQVAARQNGLGNQSGGRCIGQQCFAILWRKSRRGDGAGLECTIAVVQKRLFPSQALDSALARRKVTSISSIFSEKGLVGFPYSIAKAGWRDDQTLAKELAPDVRVNAVRRGFLWPEHELNGLGNKRFCKSCLRRCGGGR